MLFYIRYRAQFRKTRPELVTSLEKQVTGAATASGGSMEIGRKLLGASFDEDSICFWLDMVIFMEKVSGALNKVSGELFGTALVLGRDIPEIAARTLSSSITEENVPEKTGIWCAEEILEALKPYIDFGPSFLIETEGISRRFWKLKEFRSFGDREWADDVFYEKEFPFLKKIEKKLAQGNDKNTVLLGPEFFGKRIVIHHYCAGILHDVPPLVIRFGSSRCSLVYFIDAWTEELRSFIADSVPDTKQGEVITELDGLYALLFSERLRDEWSPYLLMESRKFIRLFLSAYTSAAKKNGVNGILVLEDISRSDKTAAGIFAELYSSLENAPLVLALDGSSEEGQQNWEGIFSRILKLNTDDFSDKEKAEFPGDLWEAAYNIFLLGEYFPASLLPRLFEEEGLNQDLYFRAMRLLTFFGVFARNDPRPQIASFVRRSEKTIGDKQVTKIRFAVRNRILAWENSGKIKPCFNLLKILSDLGEGAACELVLRSIRADVQNGIYRGIEKALAKGYFASLTPDGSAPVLEYAYRTLKALVWGDADVIHLAFAEHIPATTDESGRSCYAGYMAQAETNLASYYLGCRNIDAASDVLRKAMAINRDLGKDAVPAFRLFSLVNVAKQRIDDALEYISFAVEQAEKTEQNTELFLTCFYASSVNFLYGNLSKAEQFALRAEITASELGQVEWEMRARFLRGRLAFEIGRYGDALEIFESLVSEEISMPAKPAIINTVRAWIFRTRNFLDHLSPAANDTAGKELTGSETFENDISGNDITGDEITESEISGNDASLFKIEAAYLSADYKKAVALADAFLTSAGSQMSDKVSNDDFIYTEQPDWRSGFSQCEYLFLSSRRAGTRLAWIYRAMAQCALHPLAGIRAEVLGNMQHFMRDEFLPDIDPNDTFFYYAWYCMLKNSEKPEETGESQIDINTVISMAYKRLQKRAGKIDDVRARQSFLNQSRWNSSLYLAAREFKLV